MSGDADGRGGHEIASSPFHVCQLGKGTRVPEPEKVVGH